MPNLANRCTQRLPGLVFVGFALALVVGCNQPTGPARPNDGKVTLQKVDCYTMGRQPITLPAEHNQKLIEELKRVNWDDDFIYDIQAKGPKIGASMILVVHFSDDSTKEVELRGSSLFEKTTKFLYDFQFGHELSVWQFSQHAPKPK